MKPFTGRTAHVISLREEPHRWKDTAAHLVERGIQPKRFLGVNGPKWGLETVHHYETYHPEQRINSKHVGMCLSHYWLWRQLLVTGEESALIVEDDCRFHEDWHGKYRAACEFLPGTWDLLFLGSCCASDKQPEHVGGDLYRVMPLCTHSYLVRQKALELMCETQEKAWAKIDVALYTRTYPLLNCYAILPAVAYQEGTPLHP